MSVRVSNLRHSVRRRARSADGSGRPLRPEAGVQAASTSTPIEVRRGFSDDMTNQETMSQAWWEQQRLTAQPEDEFDTEGLFERRTLFATS